MRIIFISQGVDTASDQAETLVAVHGVVDQLYIRELRHKIKRGLVGQQERGFHTGGKTYGYRSVPVFDDAGRCDANGPVVMGKRLEVDQDQATVIRQIFEWYADAVSHPKIVDRLNTTNVQTQRGSPWSKRHLDRILRNERYLGKQIWGQNTYERRPGTNRLVPRKRPRDEWHVIARAELRIVDDASWQRVVDRRAALRPGRRQRRGPSGLCSPHLLIGLTRCGTCAVGPCRLCPAGTVAPATGVPIRFTTV